MPDLLNSIENKLCDYKCVKASIDHSGSRTLVEALSGDRVTIQECYQKTLCGFFGNQHPLLIACLCIHPSDDALTALMLQLEYILGDTMLAGLDFEGQSYSFSTNNEVVYACRTIDSINCLNDVIRDELLYPWSSNIADNIRRDFKHISKILCQKPDADDIEYCLKKLQEYCTPQHLRFVICLPYDCYDSLRRDLDQYFPFIDRIIQIKHRLTLHEYELFARDIIEDIYKNHDILQTDPELEVLYKVRTELNNLFNEEKLIIHR